MGLKWLTWEAWSCLGISAIISWLSCFRIFPVAKISSPMIFQAFLKNKTLKPSGPGALLLSITEITFQTSCLEVGQSKAAKQLVGTLGPNYLLLLHAVLLFQLPHLYFSHTLTLSISSRTLTVGVSNFFMALLCPIFLFFHS